MLGIGGADVTVSAQDVPVFGGPLPPLPANPIPPGVLSNPPVYQFRFSPTFLPPNCSPNLLADLIGQLFGGASFNLPLIPRVGDPLEILGRGLQNMGLQIGPLGPVLTILKTTQASVNLLKNLPQDMAQLIAFNPSPLATDVAAVVTASSDLVALAIFPLQMIKMIRLALQLLVRYLQALQSAITTLITRFTNVNALIARATALGRSAWLANANCANNRLINKATAMANFLQSIGIIIVMIQVILCLVTQHAFTIPVIPVLDPHNLVAAVFQPPIDALNIIIAALPDLSGLAFKC